MGLRRGSLRLYTSRRWVWACSQIHAYFGMRISLLSCTLWLGSRIWQGQDDGSLHTSWIISAEFSIQRLLQRRSTVNLTCPLLFQFNEKLEDLVETVDASPCWRRQQPPKLPSWKFLSVPMSLWAQKVSKPASRDLSCQITLSGRILIGPLRMFKDKLVTSRTKRLSTLHQLARHDQFRLV